MIKAVIFDLDGTLIQTEVLKATSYARAIHSLTDQQIGEKEVLDVFGEYVGLSREEVVHGLSNRFESLLSKNIKVSDLQTIKDVLITKRLKVYREILDDTKLLSQHFCPYTMGLFHQVHADDFKVVLATMSHLTEAKRITSIMGIYDKFDLVLTRDDVAEGKPNPEIYNKALNLLKLQPEECLIIEDSVNGIKAAQNAGIPVFAVTNSVTRKSVHDCKLLPSEFIVDRLEDLGSRVYDFINQQKVTDT